MQHLAPIRTNQASGISGDQNQPLTSTLQGGDSSSLSHAFEALEVERSSIRAQISPTELKFQENEANAATFGRISNDELEAGHDAEFDEVNFNTEYEQATFDAELLNKEADTFEKQAEETTDESQKQFFKSQAESKREEAEEEAEKARVAAQKAEETHDEASRRMQAHRSSEQSFSTYSTDATNYGTQLKALKSQDSALSTQLSGSKLSAYSSSGGSQVLSGSGSSIEGSAAYGYLMAAITILKQILRVTFESLSRVNPITQIAKNLTVKGLSEQAIAYLEAAVVDTAIRGHPINQQIILRKAQATTIHGDAETNIALWKEALADNKQLMKGMQDLAKMA